MYSKIVYTSCTDSGKKYAQMLSEALGIPAYRMDKSLKTDDNKVIYIGWVMAGKVMGYEKAKKKFMIGALVPVGMSLHPDASTKEFRKSNKVPDYTKIFPVQGAFHMNKLPVPFRLMMKLKSPDIVKRLEKLESLTPPQQALMQMASTGEGEPAEWNIDRIVKACK